MSGERCPVCGHEEGACTPANGDPGRITGQIITSKGVVQTRPMYPRQRTRFGRTGYVGESTGQVDVYDPDYPGVPLVQHHEMPAVDEPDDDEPTASSEEARAARFAELGKEADTLTEADVAYIEGTGPRPAPPEAAQDEQRGDSGGFTGSARADSREEPDGIATTPEQLESVRELVEKPKRKKGG